MNSIPYSLLPVLFRSLGLIIVTYLVIHLFRIKANSKGGKILNFKSPPGNCGLPFIGETLAFVKTNNSSKGFYDFVQKRYSLYGNCFKTKIFRDTHVFVSSIEAAKAILGSESTEFSKRYMKSIAELLGDQSLLCASHEKHRFIRRHILNLFTFDSMDSTVRMFDEMTVKTLDSWKVEGGGSVLNDALKNQSISYEEAPTHDKGLLLVHDHERGRDEYRLIQGERFDLSLYWGRYGAGEGNRVHYAALRQAGGGPYYGAMAGLNLHALPEVHENQGSSSVIWIVNGVEGSLDNFNAIQIGWHVRPSLYGDRDTHFFVSWTRDYDYATGCYNLNCDDGFVLEPNAGLVPGQKLSHLSTYGGQQYEITLKIYQDPSTGDWRVSGGPNASISIGYFPKSLFTSLANGASIVQYGGVVSYHEVTTGPPMGSGHFADEGFGKAAFIENLKVISKDGTLLETTNLERVEDKSSCYYIYRIYRTSAICFGGPGGCTE